MLCLSILSIRLARPNKKNHFLKFIEPLAGFGATKLLSQVGPLRRVVMNLKTNAIAWNPMEAMVFSVASEDYNLYAFDMRKLDRPINVQMDHTGAVIDLDYSPTGRELVSGSYDKTVRIWTTDSGRSREVSKVFSLICASYTQLQEIYTFPLLFCSGLPHQTNAEADRSSLEP